MQTSRRRKRSSPEHELTSNQHRGRARWSFARDLINKLLALAISGLTAAPAAAQDIFVRNVTVVHVEDGSRQAGQTVAISGDKIAWVRPSARVPANRRAKVVEGNGKFLIPGLWDMHVHSQHAGRWRYHYPLFRAHGVTGVRDAGSHLASALRGMERAKGDPLAPRIVWGSPTIDGLPPALPFGLAAEDPQAARLVARQMKRLGFDFIKVYDRIHPLVYAALADEAKKIRLPLEGHVPLQLDPFRTALAGQRAIDHLTMVLEACTPGFIDLVHQEAAKDVSAIDALSFLMDDRFAKNLHRFDPAACGRLFDTFAERHVWQIPTLVEMRGYFYTDDPEVNSDPRVRFTTQALLDEWRTWTKEAKPAELANGKKFLAAQTALIKPMHDAGVGLLAGTDASSEPWVYAGASVHDELQLFVDAGLSPLEALRTATLNPWRYLGRTRKTPLIGKDEVADLILLDADPLINIAATERIHAVIARGTLHDRANLDVLLHQGIAAAAAGTR